MTTVQSLPRPSQRDLAQKAAKLKAANAKKAAQPIADNDAPALVDDSAPASPIDTRPAALLRGSPRLLGKAEVCDRVGVCFSTIWHWMRDGKFPRARSLLGLPMWVETEIDDYLATLPVKTYLGDAEHAPESWRRRSPGKYGKTNKSRRTKSAVRRDKQQLVET